MGITKKGAFFERPVRQPTGLPNKSDNINY
jgi:hypothetical protein